MKNINTNISSVYAILGMFPVLVITGILLLISYHAQILAGRLKEQIAIELILADSLTAAETESLFTKVQQQPFTRKAKFVSKYQAAQELQKELGQDFMDILGFNPLYSKIDVFVKEEYASPAQLQNIKNNLASTPGVLEINVPLQIASVIDKIVKQLYWFFGALGTLMLLGAVLQIFNTIRLAVFSNRNIIRSMLLVGATRWFIMKPFIIQSSLNSFISGLTTVVLLSIGVYYIYLQYPELALGSDIKSLIFTFIIIIAFAQLVSILSTIFALRRLLSYKTQYLF